MKLPKLQRSFEIRAGAADLEKRTVELTFSSEAPVDRWFGVEILDHSPGAVRLERLNNGAPVLFNHDADEVLGVVESATIGKDKRGYATVRMAKTPRGDEVLALIADRIYRNVSVGYRIIEMTENKKTEEYRATDWLPYEISIVSIPADQSVGVGRAQDEHQFEVAVRAFSQPAQAETKGVLDVSTKEASAGDIADIEVRGNAPGGKGAPPSALAMEADRAKGIENLCRANNIDDNIRNHWVSAGTSILDVSEQMLQILVKRGETSKPETALGLSPREAAQFSFSRALLALADQNWSGAGFEAECSRAVMQKLNRATDNKRFLVPFEVLEREVAVPKAVAGYAHGKRDLTVGTGSAGGFTVETANVGFVELLRNKSVLYNLGATRMSGLVGNVAIPKQTVAGSAFWLANEATAITESQMTFAQIAMSPKNVGGYTELSRQLLLQGVPATEGLVRADLAAVVGLDIDARGLNGSGASGQPLGLLNTAGLGTVSGTTIGYAGIVEFQTDVFAANALFAGSGYLTTGLVAGLLKQRVAYASTASPLWAGKIDDGIVDGYFGPGYRGMASNQVPAGNLIFGDFSQIIIGEWGVLEVEVNPYANFQAGIIGVRAMASVDIAVRYPTAFSVAGTVT